MSDNFKVSRIKPKETWVRKYRKKSLRAYLEGKKNMNWIIGVLRGTTSDEFNSIVEELKRHILYPRYEEIAEILKNEIDHRAAWQVWVNDACVSMRDAEDFRFITSKKRQKE